MFKEGENTGGWGGDGGGRRYGTPTRRRKCWVEGGGWVMGVRGTGFFFLSLFEQGRECATATRSKCTGSKKDKNTAMGSLVSYDGNEPSPGWEERVVGGKLHQVWGRVDEIMLR